jgi:hypothetical protein
MDERILELAEQASKEAFPVGSMAWMETFAELIVRECADMAESFHRHQYDFTGNLELHEFIKEHFGVER